MSASRAGARSYRKGRLVINLFPHNFKVDKTVGSYTLLIQIDSFWMPNRKPKTDYRSLTLKGCSIFTQKMGIRVVVPLSVLDSVVVPVLFQF